MNDVKGLHTDSRGAYSHINGGNEGACLALLAFPLEPWQKTAVILTRSQGGRLTDDRPTYLLPYLFPHDANMAYYHQDNGFQCKWAWSLTLTLTHTHTLSYWNTMH